MSKRTKVMAILTQAGLADRELEIERMRGARGAAETSAWLNALGNLIPAAAAGVGAYSKHLDDEAMLAAENAITAGTSETGTLAEGPINLGDGLAYADGPEDAARALVDADDALNAPEKTGNFFEDAFNDPLGMKSQARERAKAGAAKALTSQVKSNRKEADALERDRQSLSMSRADAEQKRADAFAIAKQKSEDARAAAEARKPDTDKKWFDLVSSKQGHLVPKGDWERLFPGVSQPKTPTGKAAKPIDPIKAKREALLDLQITKAQDDIDQKTNPRPAEMPAEMAEKRSLKVLALSTLPKLRALKEKVGTGRFESAVKDAVGEVVPNPERKEFLRLNNSIQRTAGRILEGGKLAEGDAKTYEKFILNPSLLDDEEYVMVLDGVEDFLKEDLAIFDESMRAANRKVPTAASATDFVTVTDGNETFDIPRADLEDATDDGFIEVD